MKDPKESSLSFKNIFQRETKLAAYIIVCMTIVVISLSYALFFKVDANTNNQEVYAGDLKFTYENSGQKITSSGNDKTEICFQPMSYEEANELYRTECSYKFSVKNTGSLMANYSFGLKALSDNTIEKTKLRVIIRKKTSNGEDGVEVYENIYTNEANGDVSKLSKSLNELKTAKSVDDILVVDESSLSKENQDTPVMDETNEDNPSSVPSTEEPLESAIPEADEPKKTDLDIMEESTVDSPQPSSTEPVTEVIETNSDEILILVSNEKLEKEQTISYEIQIYFDETQYQDGDGGETEENRTPKKISYQIVGTGLVHEEQPITTDQTQSTTGSDTSSSSSSSDSDIAGDEPPHDENEIIEPSNDNPAPEDTPTIDLPNETMTSIE